MLLFWCCFWFITWILSEWNVRCVFGWFVCSFFAITVFDCLLWWYCLLRIYCVCLVRLFCYFGDWWLLLLLCCFDLSGLGIAVIAYLLGVVVWVFICLGVCVYVGCYFCWCCCLCLCFVVIVLVLGDVAIVVVEFTFVLISLLWLLLFACFRLCLFCYCSLLDFCVCALWICLWLYTLVDFLTWVDVLIGLIWIFLCFCWIVVVICNSVVLGVLFIDLPDILQFGMAIWVSYLVYVWCFRCYLFYCWFTLSG